MLQFNAMQEQSTFRQLFPGLEEKLYEEIEQQGDIRHIPAGTAMLRKGQTIRSTMLVLEGIVKLYQEDDEGNEFFMYDIEPGEACAVSMVCTYRQENSQVLAKAMTDVTVLTIPLQYMDEWLGKYKSWHYFVIRTWRARYEELLNTINTIAFKNMDERLEFYIPGSINIQDNNSFNTWAGWFLDYDTPFILLAAPARLDDLTRKLMRIGLDNIYGYIPSEKIWENAGGKLEHEPVISLDEFKTLYQNNGIQVVDLRGATEYQSGHIQGADHIFVGTLPDNLDKIRKDKKVVIHCQGGDRATIGYSLLAREGYKNILNFSEGMNKWLAEGNQVVQQ
jgi:rhodanese-related sulfurtransferase/CRP-like cAMP-binding protein